jgi:putative redox protein
MKVEVDWTAPKRFRGVAEGGTAITMDALPEHGGTGAGPSPMETLLMALAGCTGIDVVGILTKMRAPLDRLAITVEGERAPQHPRVFTRLHIRYHAAGEGLTAEQVERAVSLSLEKYCSVSAMLGKAAKIAHEVVVGAGEPGVAR